MRSLLPEAAKYEALLKDETAALPAINRPWWADGEKAMALHRMSDGDISAQRLNLQRKRFRKLLNPRVAKRPSALATTCNLTVNSSCVRLLAVMNDMTSSCGTAVV